MDFPVFHLDFFGNRMLIAFIGILHVLINHGLAVGMMPIVATMELFGYKTKNNDVDNLAYKILFICFIITTTIGALTGVGIWFAVALVNPYSIGSLIRVFFWGWFTEWIVFVIEICLILLYYTTWKSADTPEKKRQHIRIGYALAIFSWITMAIIVAILGFMMDPSNWLHTQSFFSGLLNRIYIPQLSFRTPLAMLNAGTIAMFLTIICTKKKAIDLRIQVLRLLSVWVLAWGILTVCGGYWYYKVVPSAMINIIPVAMLTGNFIDWLNILLVGVIGSVVAIFMLAQILIFKPKIIPSYVVLIPSLLLALLTGHFERVREFIRKPYIIGQYMYANGIRVGDYELLNKDGLLQHSTYSHPLSKAESINIDRKLFDNIERGKNVFMISCSRCHTGNGINGIIPKFKKAMGDQSTWEIEELVQYITTIHTVQSYMPPFPGNNQDADDLAYYIKHLHLNKHKIYGAQDAGVVKNRNDIDLQK